ncbi:MAG: universal stress protein [Sphaerochaetaceae bacterium]
MSPFSHILVLLDCSSADEAIIKLVLKLVEGSPTRVTLVHVVHSHTLDQDRALKEKADAYLLEKKQAFLAVTSQVQVLLLSGEPEVELVKEIRQGPYDLVALGTHGHKGFSDVLLGSVSKHLKHEVSTPLLMVKEDPSFLPMKEESAEEK